MSELAQQTRVVFLFEVFRLEPNLRLCRARNMSVKCSGPALGVRDMVAEDKM